jgi:peroxiredoxin
MSRLGFTVLALVLLVSALPAADQPKEQTPAEQYQALAKKYDDAMQAFNKAVEEAATQDEKRQLFLEKYPKPSKYAPRFLHLAEKYPDDAASLDALTWVLTHPGGDDIGRDGARARALDILRNDHVTSDRLGPICVAMGLTGVATDEAFLRTVLDKNPHRDVQGQACLALAQTLKNAAETRAQLQAHPGLRKQYEQTFGPEVIKELLARDPDKLAKEIEQLYERVAKQYADIKYTRGTLGRVAEAELFEIRNLAVGKTVPDLEGTDADGKKYKLNNYRGKIVVIDFWATWCGYCVRMIPHEKDLLESMHGRPFALLGISVDEKKETLKNFLAENKIPWPSLWDPADDEGSSALAGKWNVQGYPTIYIIDAKGIIRHKFVGDPGADVLDEAVIALVKEAEGNAKRMP